MSSGSHLVDEADALDLQEERYQQAKDYIQYLIEDEILEEIKMEVSACDILEEYIRMLKSLISDEAQDQILTTMAKNRIDDMEPDYVIELAREKMYGNT
jgi:hypothetical protein